MSNFRVQIVLILGKKSFYWSNVTKIMKIQLGTSGLTFF